MAEVEGCCWVCVWQWNVLLSFAFRHSIQFASSVEVCETEWTCWSNASHRCPVGLPKIISENMCASKSTQTVLGDNSHVTAHNVLACHYSISYAIPQQFCSKNMKVNFGSIWFKMESMQDIFQCQKVLLEALLIKSTEETFELETITILFV